MISLAIEGMPDVISPLIFWIQISELLRNLILGIAGLVASWVGISGLKSWTKQKKWEQKLKVGDEILGTLHFFTSLIDRLNRVVEGGKLASGISDRKVRNDEMAKTEIQFREIQEGLVDIKIRFRKNFVQSKVLFDSDLTDLMLEISILFSETVSSVLESLTKK